MAGFSAGSWLANLLGCARSDVLRGADCNRYTFHVDIPVTVMVNAAGQALLRDGLVKGKRYFSLTADYLFGHDLAKGVKNFFTASSVRSSPTHSRTRRFRS